MQRGTHTVVASAAKQSVLLTGRKMVREEREYYIYILANSTNVAVYTGVTNDLKRRVWEHKEKFVMGFAEKYDIDKLVYYEMFGDPEEAILREKQLKAGSRAKKNRLVESMNPQWRDLYDEI
ncbi:MAG: Excinuclease ABC C subunit domain protein [Dehalococcoidia bacterium]|nr:Excinuclease ABC C subunit domain protein [Dehalococcoidia bacterium]